MTKFQSVIMGASIVLGCLILGLTLNSPAIGQGPSAPGKYQMMAAGDHGKRVAIRGRSRSGRRTYDTGCARLVVHHDGLAQVLRKRWG